MVSNYTVYLQQWPHLPHYIHSIHIVLMEIEYKRNYFFSFYTYNYICIQTVNNPRYFWENNDPLSVNLRSASTFAISLSPSIYLFISSILSPSVYLLVRSISNHFSSATQPYHRSANIYVHCIYTLIAYIRRDTTMITYYYYSPRVACARTIFRPTVAAELRRSSQYRAHRGGDCTVNPVDPLSLFLFLSRARWQVIFHVPADHYSTTDCRSPQPRLCLRNPPPPSITPNRRPATGVNPFHHLFPSSLTRSPLLSPSQSVTAPSSCAPIILFHDLCPCTLTPSKHCRTLPVRHRHRHGTPP